MKVIPYNFYSKPTGKKVMVNIIIEDNRVSVEIAEPKFLRHLDAEYIRLMKADVTALVWKELDSIILGVDKRKEALREMVKDAQETDTYE